MVHSRLKSAAFLLTLGLTLTAFPQTKAEDRINQAIDDRETAVLEGNVRPAVREAVDQGRMDGGTRLESVSLVFKRTAEQDAAIEKLLAEQQDPASPNYHKWLTPEQYADRFGLSTADVSKVVSWLQAEGFTVDRVARGRTSVFFSGTVSQIETIFRTEMHRYLVKGERHFANAVDPSVPAALAGVVVGLGHLHDFAPKPRLKAQLTGHFNLGGQHVLAPADFATIYDVPTGTTVGSGQSIVVVGQSALHTSGTAFPDVDAFRTEFGLPARSTTNFATPILAAGTDPGVVSGDVDEASIDVEWSAAVAPGAKVIYIYAGASSNGAFGAIQYAIDNNSAPIISTSFGTCEANLASTDVLQFIALGQQANAQGQTLVAAAGDFGAADCDSLPQLPAQGGLAVDIPAALPYVTGVGGTEFTGDPSGASQYWNATNGANNGSALKYIPETTWNDTAMNQMLDATGGGASILFSKPSWQTGTGVPSDGVRDVPDIALSGSNQHDPYVVCTGGTTPCSNALFGGTSFGAPTFAGIVAILNQKIGATKGQGNVNPTLYSLAASAPSAFHDITSGNNIVPCGAATPNCPTSGTLQYGFSAGTGYDQVTGLGTLDVNALATAWAGATPGAADFHVYGAVASISAPGGSTTSTIVVDGVNGFSGTVSLTVSCPSSASITCSLNPSSVTPTGTNNTASATLMINTHAAGLDPRNVPLWLGGSGAMFASVFLFGTPAWRRRWRAGALLLMVALLIAAVGCGGSSNSHSKPAGTPAGTYLVTVTGSSGSTSHTTTISVKVI
jgi:subtilase family serine protease